MRRYLFQGWIITLLLISANSLATENSMEDHYLSNHELNMGFYTQGDGVSLWGDTIDEMNNELNLKGGVNSPRARFYINGKVNDWFYCFAFDAAEVLVREAFLRYEEFSFFRMTMGQYKIPVSFWFLNSQSRFNFLEQGLPDIAFNPGFRIGLQTQFFHDPFTLTLGLAGPDIAYTSWDQSIQDQTPLFVYDRFTYSPIHVDGKVIHFAMASLFLGADSSSRLQFSAFPEIQTYSNHELLDTGSIDQCKSYWGHDWEGVFILNSFTLSGQYHQTYIKRNPHDLYFDGYYFTVDYFLTGEHYQYDFKEGAITGISPICHAYGAWQLAARYSYLDLQDKEIMGGREENITLGLNWIVNDHVKFLLNFITVNTHPSENGLNRQIKILALRLQLSAEGKVAI